MKANARTAPSQKSTPRVISNQDLDLPRKDLRSKKKQLIAENLKLADTEAIKFWPVYDEYTAELSKISGTNLADSELCRPLGNDDKRPLRSVY
jgi:hypothetical protein